MQWWVPNKVVHYLSLHAIMNETPYIASKPQCTFKKLTMLPLSLNLFAKLCTLPLSLNVLSQLITLPLSLNVFTKTRYIVSEPQCTFLIQFTTSNPGEWYIIGFAYFLKTHEGFLYQHNLMSGSDKFWILQVFNKLPIKMHQTCVSSRYSIGRWLNRGSCHTPNLSYLSDPFLF